MQSAKTSRLKDMFKQTSIFNGKPFLTPLMFDVSILWVSSFMFRVVEEETIDFFTNDLRSWLSMLKEGHATKSQNYYQFLIGCFQGLILKWFAASFPYILQKFLKVPEVVPKSSLKIPRISSLFLCIILDGFISQTFVVKSWNNLQSSAQHNTHC